MFARLTKAQIKIDRVDEFIKRYKKSVVPATKAQKGFKGLYLLVDRQTGYGISFSLWESEEDVLANERNRFYQEQVAKFVNFYAKPPTREGYEVIVQELNLQTKK